MSVLIAVNFCHLFEEGLLQTLWTFKMFMCNWSLMCSMVFFIISQLCIFKCCFCSSIYLLFIDMPYYLYLLLFTCISYQFNTDCLAFYIINVHLFWLVINVTWKIGKGFFISRTKFCFDFVLILLFFLPDTSPLS